MMKEKMDGNASLCTRAEDLVTYLYGEASADEAHDFERHMKQCGSCSTELAAFRTVREGVIEWRNLSLPSFDAAPAQVLSASTSPARKPSALAALREFFTLAPMWMRAATAVAALIVCALVVFTVMHFSEPAAVVQVAPSQPNQPTQAQVEQMVERRAQELRQQERQEAAVPSVPEKETASVVKNNEASQPSKSKRAARASVARREANRVTPDKVKASQEVARQQLAELVQSSKEDDGLPRLSDLFEDSNESQ